MLNQKIVICGLGGQGILFMARVLYETAVRQGLQVMGSETHGMSQRGGSVTSHVKIGPYASPMVRAGTGDVLFVLKAEEAYANLWYLRNGGSVMLNAEDSFELVSPVSQALEARDVRTVKCDATGMAVKLGNPKATNLVLLGTGIKAGVLHLDPGALLDAVKTVSPPQRVDGNVHAVRAGIEG